MGSGFSEAALAVFTTLGPMGACAFAVIAAAFSYAVDDDEALAKRLDRMTLIPLLVTLAGFLGATAHLANAMNAPFVALGIGRSPLSNEVTVGGVFLLVALVYWILAIRGSLKPDARKAYLTVLAVFAVVFAAFCGFAYLMYTIPTWDNPWTVIQMVGYGLLGGSALGTLVVRAADVDFSGKLARFAVVMAVCGLALGAIGFGAQIALASSISNIWGTAVSLVPAIWGIFTGFLACGAFGVAMVLVSAKRQIPTSVLVVACVVVALGVFFARIGFYGLFMSVAL